ncbi:DUF4166 domain-containing protein [Chitinimonas sp. BJB300]|uniref:DUF4166 domain-containing protein n=1 Tax=Chitinimonas sp. BJB300 TaxID=1559339 RepID=UPI000C0D0841|nr:DUF4166 domain-containing protein [Chitinimonas sp. BJB300]PHV12008.1 hypothetical protein CSQ89_08070 [Chitinimonas sp. BJB300]TSJ91451.1 DUF4166 domain-containing protein [Chitinimonas sp. BJB300]
MPSLYQTALGPEFGQLVPLLQWFHTEVRTVWQGEATVRWSRNPLFRLLVLLARLPKEGEDIAVAVQLFVHDGKEIWQRRFADRPMVSRQYMDADGLCESMGLFSLLLSTEVHEGGLIQHSTQSRWLGISLPTFLALRVMAKEWSERGRMHFDVTIYWGRWELIRYTGWLQPIYSRWLPSNSDSEIYAA